jgi:hypothetical protein
MADTTNMTGLVVKSDRSEKGKPFEAKRLLWAGPLTGIVASLGTVLVREIGVVVGAIPAEVVVMQEPVVALSTIIAVLVGTLVFAAILRFSDRPLRTWQFVAVTAGILSMSSPIAAGAGWSLLGFSLAAETVAFLIVMHTVAAVVTIYLLPALARRR